MFIFYYSKLFSSSHLLVIKTKKNEMNSYKGNENFVRKRNAHKIEKISLRSKFVFMPGENTMSDQEVAGRDDNSSNHHLKTKPKDKGN